VRLLVIKLGAFGDIIHSLPALHDLLQRPGVDELHWLVDERYAFVTGIFPEEVTVHRVALKGPSPWRSAYHCIRSLRQLGFDAVLDLQGLIKSGLIAHAINPHAYGFDAASTPEKGNDWLVRPVRFHPAEKHVVQQYRRIATGPFISDVSLHPETAMPYAAPTIRPTETMQQAFDREKKNLDLGDAEFAVLHLGGGWETKQLPRKKWQEIIAGVRASGCLPLLSWGNAGEQRLATDLAAKGHAVALNRPLPMQMLCGLLVQARAVIGTDTGVLHLAAALGTPTATFWGPSASWRSAPLHDGHVHAESAPECGPCFKRTCDHFTCMDRIRAEDLLEVLRDR